MIAIIIIVVIFCIILYINKINKIQFENFSLNPLDSLETPFDSQTYNEIDIRGVYRLIGIYTHFVLDKYNRVKYITYTKPIPKIGETKCYKLKCPNWLNNVHCWKCI